MHFCVLTSSANIVALLALHDLGTINEETTSTDRVTENHYVRRYSQIEKDVHTIAHSRIKAD